MDTYRAERDDWRSGDGLVIILLDDLDDGRRRKLRLRSYKGLDGASREKLVEV